MCIRLERGLAMAITSQIYNWGGHITVRLQSKEMATIKCNRIKMFNFAHDGMTPFLVVVCDVVAGYGDRDY